MGKFGGPFGVVPRPASEKFSTPRDLIRHRPVSLTSSILSKAASQCVCVCVCLNPLDGFSLVSRKEVTRHLSLLLLQFLSDFESEKFIAECFWRNFHKFSYSASGILAFIGGRIIGRRKIVVRSVDLLQLAVFFFTIVSI